MKKVLSAFAAVIMAVAVCAGCGSVKPNEVFSVADLTGKTIGVQLGTTGDIYAQKEVKGANIESYKNGADAVQALKQGKVDAVIIDNEPAKVFVSKNSDLKILDEEFITEQYAIAIKKGNTELTEAINTALAELKADGTMDSITANWIGDEKGSHPYVSPEGIEYPNGTLIMATNAQFAPYEAVENGEVVGFDVDMMHAVCDKLGYQLEIENMDFDSIITAVSSGKAHVGVAGMTVTEDRLKNIDFSDSYTTATQVIIVRAK